MSAGGCPLTGAGFHVTVLDPRLAPKIEGIKDTYLDVRVRDERGRLNAGDPYHVLTEVVAVTVTDFVMFPDLAGVVSRFRLRADENPLIVHRDLELVFAELPKFTRTEADLETAARAGERGSQGPSGGQGGIPAAPACTALRPNQ